MRKLASISIAALAVWFCLYPQAKADYINLVKQGNEAFTNQDYAKAMEYYHQAETELPESPELAYNLGNSFYGQGQYEAAIEQYTKALNSPDIKIEQKAHYNLGNTHFRSNDYQKAISEFQEALKLDPNDVDAKFNLELARKMLKEQIKPQNGDNKDKKQQQQQNQQDKDKQDQDKQDKEKQKQDQQNKQDSTQNQQSQDQKDSADSNQNKDQQMKQAKQGQKMSKEDAERILNALKDDEQKIQQNLKRARGEAVYSGKDW